MLQKRSFYLNGSLWIFLLAGIFLNLSSLEAAASVVQRPIDFGEKRIELTKLYLKERYGMIQSDIKIKPQMVVLHWTAVDSLEGSFNAFKRETLEVAGRGDIQKATNLNVSAHYLVDKDGTIYQLMPENWMARHVIGLNAVAIGIENVGGKDHKEDLTVAQLQANAALLRDLKRKYPDIRYLIGHYEYRDFEGTPLWKEKDPKYRTGKQDPGKKFMTQLRKEVQDLGFQSKAR